MQRGVLQRYGRIGAVQRCSARKDKGFGEHCKKYPFDAALDVVARVSKSSAAMQLKVARRIRKLASRSMLGLNLSKRGGANDKLLLSTEVVVQDESSE